MIPKWLVEALGTALDQHDGPDTNRRREAIAEQLYDAMCAPRVALAIATAIAQTAHVVLTQRGIQDAGGDMAREIGRNCAQTVLFAISDT